ncbi:MAG: hypothetical protein LBH74_10060 [Nitrososphaerota archaeon]|jgi:hypothetical protein|uniref:hypothetical protein n=1 Tax=Candidatus Bathycorpusculum sp. TaxID=2994959 RepID=UPI002829C749|nr:hypothetical protein [Candidatus Termitimicrobium sp.]MCL2431605.1 hypothetical protein [Candidatus Termitimicrobium sp.]MDR0493958.1 hypothetical protein [Nitrososphaerota archaeon]
MKKIVSAFICALLVCTLLFTGITSVDEVQAQNTPKKPAVPEFTVNCVTGSTEVPSVYSTDPYTGETVTQPGYSEKFVSIEIKIKNQNHPNTVKYNIRTKGHYEESWKNAYNPNVNVYDYPQQDEGQYTLLYIDANDYPDGGKVDVQVEAMDGYLSWEGRIIASGWVFVGETSGWSKTKTVTITRERNEVPNQTEPTPNPTYSSNQPPQPELSIIQFPLTAFILVLILCPLIIVALIIALIYEKRKTARQKRLG